MSSLERFLLRVAIHPVLQKSENFKTFLEKDFLSTESGRRESFMENISDAFMNAFSKVQLPDERFINFNLQIAKLETHLKNLDKSQQSVFKHQLDLFEDSLDLVPSFSNLAHLEKDLFDVFLKLAEVQEKIQKTTKESVDGMENHVHSIIREFIQYSRSAKVIGMTLSLFSQSYKTYPTSLPLKIEIKSKLKWKI